MSEGNSDGSDNDEMKAHLDVKFAWRRLVVCVVTVSCAVTSCGPPTRAVVGVARSNSDIEALVYVCDDQPRLTLRLYIDGQQPNAYLTLVGKLKRNEMARVPLTMPSPGWHLEGGRSLVPGRAYVIDIEDGGGGRLDASILFKLSDVPRTGVFTELSKDDEKSGVISLGAFTQRGRSTC